jgi:alpha-tubulin suppressor-like RCC1 family protein/FtsZ-binding cell division protein ZapB
MPMIFRLLVVLWLLVILSSVACYNIGTSWRNNDVFAALKQDGSVAVWGRSNYGGSGVPEGLSNVLAVFSTFSAFAALKGDGTVIAWGDREYGGEVPAALSNVKMIYSVYGAFAALKEDGKVVAWGDPSRGSNRVPADLDNVTSICSAYFVFAALKEDGTVVAWSETHLAGKVPKNLNNVKALFSTTSAFAALKEDGTVVAWGSSNYGGAGVPDDLSGVISISSSSQSFCALKEDGTFAAWGSTHGTVDAWQAIGLGNIISIFSSSHAFAVLNEDGKVAVFGSKSQGGAISDGSNSFGDKYTGLPANLNNDVRTIFSTTGAFAALKEDGTVFAWGLLGSGGVTCAAAYQSGSYESKCETGSDVSSELKNVKTIVSAKDSFAALKKDGKVVAWGRNSDGECNVPPSLGNVIAIFSTEYTFAVLKDDNKVSSWGQDVLPADLNQVINIFGSTMYYSDSTAGHNYPCPPGSYGSGVPDCTVCPGTSSLSSGAQIRSTISSCMACETLGRRYSVDGLTCSKTCGNDYTFLPPVFFNDGLPTCRRCRFLGEYYHETKRKCALCPFGKFGNTSGVCELCEKGKYASSEGQTGCSRCPNGFTTVVEGGAQECYKICEPGYHGKVGDSSCFPCLPDTYSNIRGLIQCSSCRSSFGPGFGTNGAPNSSTCMFEGCDPGHRTRYNDKGIALKCIECAPGNYSNDGKNCENCVRGSYADKSGLSKCIDCPIGRYNKIKGAIFSMECLPCPKGKYNSFPGSYQCQVCPPGQECNTTGLSKGYDCAKGTYALYRGSEKCLRCPAGRYESNPGEAQCSACPGGKFNERLGSSALGDCEDCPAGTFAFTNGSSQCLQCGKTEYQPEKGQTMCFQCAGVGRIGNVERTSCIVDPAFAKLNGPSLVDSLYSKGLALYITFSIAALFTGATFLVHFKKAGFNNAEQSSSQSGSNEIDSSLLGMLTPLQIGMKSGIAGLSFGSELLLIITYLGQAPWSAAGLIVFRLLHAIVAGMFLSILFGYDAIAVWLEEKGIVHGASKLRQLLNDKFSLENLPFVMMPVLLSMIDCPFLQFVPWRDSTLYRESKGFPSLSLLKWSLGTDVLQATASAIIQIYQLATRQTSSSQEKALTGMNITFSFIGIASSLVVFCLKTALLERKEDVKDTTPELEAVYQLEERKNLGFIMKNPMYDSSNDVEDEALQAPESMSTLQEKHSIEDTRLLRSQIGTLEQDNSALKEENNALKEETNLLKEENSTMKEETYLLKEENSAFKARLETLKRKVT